MKNIDNDEYIDFLKTREIKDILLIKKELYEDIRGLKKNAKKFKLYSIILKNKILNKIFSKKISKKIIKINPDSEKKYNKKKELYSIVNKYLKEMND